MITISIFAISGLAIPLLIIAKKMEQRRRKPFLFLKLIAKSNISIRKIYHMAVHLYSISKEKVIYFLKRLIPLHSRNSSNKLLSRLRGKKEQYVNKLRDSRLLKRPEGISEFFKNMSSTEKGNGEIHDVYENDSQEEEKQSERSHLSDSN